MYSKKIILTNSNFTIERKGKIKYSYDKENKKIIKKKTTNIFLTIIG